MTEKANKPEKVIGKGCPNVAIWADEREGQYGKYTQRSVRINNGYRDPKTGQWQNTDRLNRRDLLIVAKYLERAFDYMSDREGDPETDE